MIKKDVMRIPDYLGHILEALKRIFDYVDEVQDAVLRHLEQDLPILLTQI